MRGQYSMGFTSRAAINLPVVAQILLLTTDFRFKASVMQTARSTEKTRRMTTDWFQELLRGHALYGLTLHATVLSSPSASVAGEMTVLYTRARYRKFITDYIFPSTYRTRKRKTDWPIRKTVCLMRGHSVQVGYHCNELSARHVI